MSLGLCFRDAVHFSGGAVAFLESPEQTQLWKGAEQGSVAQRATGQARG